VALTPKERENIIEEETLRYETRKNLCCPHGSRKPWRWLWRLLGILLVVILFGRIFCGSRACDMNRHHCAYGQEEGTAPGQPVPPAAKK
jgi:hypothetical protein